LAELHFSENSLWVLGRPPSCCIFTLSPLHTCLCPNSYILLGHCSYWIVRVKVKVAQSCLTLQSHGLYSPWNSPGQNTGVGSNCVVIMYFLASMTLGFCGRFLHDWLLHVIPFPPQIALSREVSHSFKKYLFMWLSGLNCGTRDLSLWHMDSVVTAHRLSCPATYGILVPQPRIKLASHALEGIFLTKNT